ncbi:MAG: glycosyltransferase family 39 protein [Armatimonadota bacterium]|nr:MAG: glycosyltransferase family 39 protein [Armatimonadota bacterium]
MPSLITWFQDHPRRAAWLAAAALLILAFAIYGQTLNNGWVIAPEDDEVWLSMIKGAGLADIPSWFVSQPAFFYRPVARVSFYLDYLVWGDNPFGFRLTQLLLYVAAAAALGWLMHEVTRSRLAGFCAASLYVAYPRNWEVAYWVSTRADVLAALFALASLALLARAGRKRRLACWLGAMACAAAALFSKEVALALPLLVLVWAAIASPPLRKAGYHWAWAGITFAVLLAMAAGYWTLRSAATPMGTEHVSEFARLDIPLLKALRWGGSWWYRPLVLDSYYIRRGVVPGGAVLLVDPARFVQFWGTLAVWAGALVLAFVRAPRPALMFFAFHALAALPAAGEIAHVPFRRFFYLPVAGDQALTALVLWVALVWCRERWPRWGWAALSPYVALLAVFAWGAAARAAGLGPRLFGR